MKVAGRRRQPRRRREGVCCLLQQCRGANHRTARHYGKLATYL